MFASFIAKSVPKNIYNNINIIKNTVSNAKFDMEQRGTMRKAISQKKNDLLVRLTQADAEESVSSENALPNVKFRAPGRRNGSLKEKLPHEELAASAFTHALPRRSSGQ
ncbi:hypothetical protein [Mailhella sp.]|uniref:hypothetical protein n=1 Tax=Mailhella sp. TaxID=1981029 RepID=UPI003AB35B3C